MLNHIQQVNTNPFPCNYENGSTIK